MKINKHIPFRIDEHPQLVDYLSRNGLAFCRGDIISSLDIYESDPHWPDIAAYVQSRKMLCLSETTFSKKELSSAQWLTVRSKWRNGYPQPEGAFGYQSITYSDGNYCNECGAGLIQTEAFRMKAAPKWGNRHFMMLNWVEDELFADEVAKSVLQGCGITGVSFREVKNKTGTEILPGVEQLIVPYILRPGIVAQRRSIDKIFQCTSCGIPKYHPTGIGMHAFKREIFENAPDVVKTGEVFGWGHSAPRLIIVSQKVYRAIIENHLDRGLVFSPLELV